jgi:hypothetical protein
VAVVMKIVAPAGIMQNTTDIKSMVDKFVESFDPDANSGRGELKVTALRHKALTFPDPAVAMMFWKTQSRVQPVRLDGKPNRPLTAWTVSIEPL